jgi:hypothetical protein
LGLLGAPITNLRGPIGAFRASSRPLGSPIRVFRGPNLDALGAQSGPSGDPIGALRGPIRAPSGIPGAQWDLQCTPGSALIGPLRDLNEAPRRALKKEESKS